MLDYYVGIRRVTGEHLHQTLLYIGRQPLRIKGIFESPSTRHEYSILNLREMDGTELLSSEDWADNEWALLTKTDPEKVIRVVFDKIRGLSGAHRPVAAPTNPGTPPFRSRNRVRCARVPGVLSRKQPPPHSSFSAAL